MGITGTGTLSSGVKKSPILRWFRRKYSKIVNKPKVERTWEGRGGGRTVGGAAGRTA